MLVLGLILGFLGNCLGSLSGSFGVSGITSGVCIRVFFWGKIGVLCFGVVSDHILGLFQCSPLFLSLHNKLSPRPATDCSVPIRTPAERASSWQKATRKTAQKTRPRPQETPRGPPGCPHNCSAHGSRGGEVGKGVGMGGGVGRDGSFEGTLCDRRRSSVR